MVNVKFPKTRRNFWQNTFYRFLTNIIFFSKFYCFFWLWKNTGTILGSSKIHARRNLLNRLHAQIVVSFYYKQRLSHPVYTYVCLYTIRFSDRHTPVSYNFFTRACMAHTWLHEQFLHSIFGDVCVVLLYFGFARAGIFNS